MQREFESQRTIEITPGKSPTNEVIERVGREITHCDLLHMWNFEVDGRNQQEIDEELQEAIRHVVTYTHTINGAEYGGYLPDETLEEKLNLAWFQKVGLLKPVALQFKGEIADVVRFAWPEGFHQEEQERVQAFRLRPDTIEFWQELKKDLEGIQTPKNMALSTFMMYYDPRTKRQSYLEGGKYIYLYGLFFQDTLAEESIHNPVDYLSSRFNPPRDNQEFIDLVKETRELAEIKLRKPYGSVMDIQERLADPSFLEEFVIDLNEYTEDFTFANFMQGWLNYTTPNGDIIRWSARGKYRELLNDLLARRWIAQLGENAGSESTPKKPAEIFYEAAPQNLKLLLLAKFPKDFSHLTLESLEQSQVVSDEVRAILEETSLLGVDSQDRILETLGNYILAKHKNNESLNYLDGQRIKTILLQVSQQILPAVIRRAASSKTESVLTDSRIVPTVLSEANSENQEVADSAQELLESLREAYYFPLLKSLLYKPTALFWTSYLTEHPEEVTVPPAMLINFLEKHLKGRVEEIALQGDQKEVLGYLSQEVLPNVYRHFAEVATFAQTIAHFRTKDIEGKPQHLLFHQVEGIKKLIEDKGGIVSDEPGTGKTLILALSALNLMDRSGIVGRGTPGRALVVGTKSVIDNWESELDAHIRTDYIDVVNVNFTNQKDRQVSRDELQARLRELERLLRNPRHQRQMVLVNYDLFRHPTFKKILGSYPFDSVIVDEAHNVKSRFLESINTYEKSDDLRSSTSVAKRTRGLYSYIRTSPDLSVFFATSTPYVKELVEPLIMAHLVNEQLVPRERVQQLMEDTVGTHQVLRQVMIRRKKEEIADLPPKETVVVPIDLTLLSEEEKQEFKAIAQEIMENENFAARFYSMLSLEGLAKYPWLTEKVKELISDGRKVIIFTPFVVGENRYTAPISTARIAAKLMGAGIPINSVAVLDGSLDEGERISVQGRFRNQRDPKVLVGNYITAGESITLNSPTNRATEVIIFVGPNTITRYIQGVDRSHRIGQTEKVTIHIPYVTGDLLGRGETYDEAVIKRLMDELVVFGAVVDGRFFMEPKDIYQSIIQTDRAKPRGSVEFTREHRQRSRERRRGPYTPRLPGEPTPRVMISEDEVIDFGWMQNIREVVTRESESEQDIVRMYLEQIGQYPLFNPDNPNHERLAFDYFKSDRTLDELKIDSEFLSMINPRDREDFGRVLTDSQSIQDLIINCNLRLVVSVARQRQGRGLPLLDLIQEGTFGLMHAVELFEPERGNKFSTYATWWIRQSINRAIMNSSQTIRLPVHMYERIGLARRFAREFEATNGRTPKVSELRELVLTQTKFSESEVDSVIETIASGVMQMGTLDFEIGEDGEDTLYDVVADKRMDVEATVLEETEDDELNTEVKRALKENLDERERRIIELRFGLGETRERTLEEVGQEFGLTRERVRQIQERSLGKLSRDKQLRARWEGDAPSFVYHTSAEQAAIRLGLFNKKQSYVEKVVAELPPHLQSVLNQRILKAASLINGDAQNGTSEVDQSYQFTLARLAVWEKLGTLYPDDLTDSRQRREIYGKDFGPYFDLSLMKRLYERRDGRVRLLDNRVLSHFFGFGDGQKPLLSVEKVTQELGIPQDTVTAGLHKGLQVLEAPPEKKTRAEELSREHSIVAQAFRNQEIWDQIPDREKSILTLYFIRGGDQQVLKENFSRIFGISLPEVDARINAAVELTERLLTEIQAKPERQRRVTRGELRDMVEGLLKEYPWLSNSEVTEHLSTKLKQDLSKARVDQARKSLVALERVESRRGKLDILDSRVEALLLQGLKPQQIAESLVQSEKRVIASIRRLISTGNLDTQLIQWRNDGLSKEEIAERIGSSAVTIGRRLRVHVESGALPFHPRDPRTVDDSGVTEHVRNLDGMVESLILQDPKIKTKEIIAALEPTVGKYMAELTIRRAKKRLVAAGRIPSHLFNLTHEEAVALDQQVEELVKNGNLSYKEIAAALNQPISRIRNSKERLVKTRRIEPNPKYVDKGASAALEEYLSTHHGDEINLSEFARSIGISRERASQLYKRLTNSQLKELMTRRK